MEDWQYNDAIDALGLMTPRDAFDVRFLSRLAGEIARRHGFVNASHLECMALIHSEVSEATEDLRKEGVDPKAMTFEPSGKPIGVPSEMADIVIRVMHYCDAQGIDLAGAIRAKMLYNATRPFKHGKAI